MGNNNVSKEYTPLSETDMIRQGIIDNTSKEGRSRLIEEYDEFYKVKFGWKGDNMKKIRDDLLNDIKEYHGYISRTLENRPRGIEFKRSCELARLYNEWIYDGLPNPHIRDENGKKFEDAPFGEKIPDERGKVVDMVFNILTQDQWNEILGLPEGYKPEVF